MTAPWWHGAVGYEIYVRSFADANNDGTGDLEGIRRRLPYLSWLGVDAVWITPFYPSPGFDHGYDVADYVDVDPRHGTLEDFDRLVADAHDLGLRVVVDLVPNHTSSHHPWFRAALQGPDDPYRDYYVWRDPAPGGGPPNNWVSHFGGPAWTLDRASGQFYLHLFLPEQPDLNWTNPAVADEFDEILRFWSERGADGFRIDVAHGLAKDPWFRDNPRMGEITPDMDPGEVFHAFEHRYDIDQNPNVEVYRRWNHLVAPYRALLLGEVGLDQPVRVARYHDAGTALHRNFYLQIQWMEWDPMRFRDLVRGMHLAAPDSTAWVLGSHDTSHTVTRFGGGDRGVYRVLCAKTLMLALGGIPFTYQGEELGLPDGKVDRAHLEDPIATRNPGAVGRDAARTIMPWDDSPNQGFNEGARPWMESHPRPEHLTVAAQRSDAGSHLSRYRGLLAWRRGRPHLWSAPLEWLDGPESLLMACRRGTTIVAANLDEHESVLHLPPGSWKPGFASRNGVPDHAVSRTVVIPAETAIAFDLQ